MKFEKAAQQLKGLKIMPPEAAKPIYDHILHSPIVKILELGTYYGKSACFMAAALHEKGQGEVVTLDFENVLLEHPNVHETAERLGLSDYIRFQPCGKRGYLIALRDMIKNGGQFDFCYIDAGHVWEQTGFAFYLVDILLKTGGWIVFDDLKWKAGEVGDVFELLVKRHPAYYNFGYTLDNHQGWAQKKALGGTSTDNSSPAQSGAVRSEPLLGTDQRQREGGEQSREPAAVGADILFQGLRLPPKELRSGSFARRDDASYVRYAKNSVKLLADQCGLSQQSKLLDIGCGSGRLLIGALSLYGAIEEYVGLDVNKPAIEWASRHLADAQHITFHWMNILNQRYNPKGATTNAEIMFPVPADRFDVVALLSVFSHMYLQDIGAYLKEIRRILTPSGKVFLTLFVEAGVPAEEENPPEYLNKWSGPLHCVRINRHSFEDAVYESGLLVQAYRYRHLSSGQSSYILSRSDGGLP